MPELPGPIDAETPVLLKAGAEFHGLLALDGPARIEGRLQGEVIGPGPLWIGPAAEVEARIETDELVVAGRLAGAVRASHRVSLEATARVQAELETPSLALAEGALLEGRCCAGVLPTQSPGRAPEAFAAPPPSS